MASNSPPKADNHIAASESADRDRITMTDVDRTRSPTKIKSRLQQLREVSPAGSMRSDPGNIRRREVSMGEGGPAGQRQARHASLTPSAMQTKRLGGPLDFSVGQRHQQRDRSASPTYPEEDVAMPDAKHVDRTSSPNKGRMQQVRDASPTNTVRSAPENAITRDVNADTSSPAGTQRQQLRHDLDAPTAMQQQCRVREPGARQVEQLHQRRLSSLNPTNVQARQQQRRAIDSAVDPSSPERQQRRIVRTSTNQSQQQQSRTNIVTGTGTPQLNLTSDHDLHAHHQPAVNSPALQTSRQLTAADQLAQGIFALLNYYEQELGWSRERTQAVLETQTRRISERLARGEGYHDPEAEQEGFSCKSLLPRACC